ncbi:TPA: hypothetical protein ACH3X1_014290 [Trebouxia sp. C0004]
MQEELICPCLCARTLLSACTSLWTAIYAVYQPLQHLAQSLCCLHRTTRGQKRKVQSVTTAQPFGLSTDARGEATKTALQKAAAERAAHNYKAKPVPANLRHKKQLALPEPHLTVPETCPMPGAAVHEHAEDLRRQQLAEEEQQRRTHASFRAQPVRTGHGVAIQPSEAPLTVPEAPNLSLQDRTAACKAFDAAVAEKQRLAEAEQAAAQEAIRLAEEEDLQEHTRDLQFKACPMQ